MIFTIKIAEVNIKINSIYNAVYNMCKDYLTEDSPDFSVTVTQSDIDFEREKSIAEAKREGRVPLNYKDEYLETLAVYRKIATGSLSYNAFLMHGAVVALGGSAYMFTAPSGVGKTTHTHFWLKKYPEAFILNGDKPIIKVTENGVFACGTPWSGKESLNRNTILPLKAVCALQRGKENEIRPISFSDIFPLIIAQTYRPADEESIKKTLELIKALGDNVKFYALKCNLDPDAARVAKEGMADE